MRYLGLGFGLLAGCVAGWLWATKPESLANIDFLEAAQAVGAIVTGVAVVYLTWRQQKQLEEEKKQRAQQYVRIQYLNLQLLYRDTILLACKINSASVEIGEEHRLRELIDEIKRLADRALAFDVHLFALVDQVVSQDFKLINEKAVSAMQSLEHKKIKPTVYALKAIEGSVCRLSDLAKST